MRAKKAICCLVALFFMGLPVAIRCNEVILLHRFEDGLFGRYIDRTGFVIYDAVLESYFSMDCVKGLHFNCIKQVCGWPEDGCPCIR